jgi:predicted GNAT superfamily acetyltransferase
MEADAALQTGVQHMSSDVAVTLLDASHPRWAYELERAGILLGLSANPTLFPYHFLYATLSKIGGKLAIFRRGAAIVGVGFLFPRRLSRLGDRMHKTYTLRFHSVHEGAVNSQEMTAACERVLPEASVVFYDPTGGLSYYRTSALYGMIDIGRPDEFEAAESRAIQQRVWGAAVEFLYPGDIHSSEFGAGTSLVARVDGKTAGFLFGFYSFGGVPLPADWEERFNGAFRIESQTLGVLPEYRGLRIANLLKKQQAELAWREGVGVVSWTADPLQYPNAALNFGLLKAMAFHFTPNLYPFRNELNRIHASRFSLIWLVGSKRVREMAPLAARAEIVDLSNRPRIPRANDGCRAARFDLDDEVIAIEIPANWTSLQAEDPVQAQEWRMLTDEIFSTYIGLEEGRYTVTGVGTAGERRFLIAERSGKQLWQRLGEED